MATTEVKNKKTKRGDQQVGIQRKSSIHANRLDPEMAVQFPDWFAEVNQKWRPTALGRLLNAKAGHPLLWGTEGLWDEPDANFRKSLGELDRPLRGAAPPGTPPTERRRMATHLEIRGWQVST